MRLVPNASEQQEIELLDSICEELELIDPDLPRLLVERLKENPSAAMPYHGNLHTLLFLKSALLLSKDERVSLTVAELTALVTAAIHHDFDYRTTSEDDMKNILAAKEAWISAAEQWIPVDRELVLRLIDATYLGNALDEKDPEFKIKSVMRDSDLLVWIFPEFFETLADGLKQEKGYEPYTGNFFTHFHFYNERARELIEEAGLA